jgi:manganese transport protein
MEGGSERAEVGREVHHGGVVESGSDTGDHKYSTADGEKDGKFQVQVYCYI